MDITDISKVASRKRMNTDAEKLREKVSRETAKIIKLKVAQDTAYWDLKEKLQQVEGAHERLQQNMVDVQMQHEEASANYQHELRMRPDTLNKAQGTRDICDVLEQYGARLQRSLERAREDRAALAAAYVTCGARVRMLGEALEQARRRGAGERRARQLAAQRLGDALTQLGAARAREHERAAAAQRAASQLEHKDKAAAEMREDLSRLMREFDGQSVEMRKNIASREQEALALRSALGEAQAEHRSVLAEQQRALEAQQAERVSLQRALEAEQAERASLQCALEAEQTKRTSLQRALETEQAERTSLQRGLESEQAKSASLQRALESEQAERSSLQRVLEAKQAEHASLQRVLEAEQAKRASLQRTLEAEQAWRAELHRGLEAAQAEQCSVRASLQRALDERDEEQRTRAELLAKAENEIELLKKIEANHIDDITNMQKNISDKSQREKDMVEEIDSLKNTVRALEEEKTQATERANVAQHENESLARAAAELRAALQDERDAVRDLTDACAAKDRSLHANTGSISSLMADLKSETEARARTDAALQAAARRYDAERAAAQAADAAKDDKLRGKDDELRAQMSIIIEMRAEKERLQERIRGMQGTIDNIQHELTGRRAPESRDVPEQDPPKPASADALLYSFLSDGSVDGDALDPREVGRRFQALARGAVSLRRCALPAQDSMSVSQLKGDLKAKNRTFFKNKRFENKVKKHK